MTDPRFTDPRLSDPVLRSDDSVAGMWGWVAGLAVLALVAFIVIAGWTGNSETAGNSTMAPTTTSSAPIRNVTPPSTTGSGSTSPQPAMPAPMAPATNGAR
jgi:hypothetical protein